MDEKILIIDDEERILQTFARLLKLDGHTVFTAAGGADGVTLYGREQPALTFVDLRMPGKDGFAVLHEIRAQDPEAEVILMTGHGDKDTVIAALRADASDFIPKPIEHEVLDNVLRRALERLQWKRELHAAQNALRESHAHLEQQVAARTAELATANATLHQRNQEMGALNAALQASETRFRSIFEQAAVGLSHSTLDGAFIRVNQRFCDIVGYTQAELTQLTFQDMTHPDDLNSDLTQMQRVLTGALQTYILEKRYYRKDSVLIWVNLTVSLVRDLSGAPEYFIGVIEDITARKQAEDALRASEERYRLIFQRSPVGILHYDTNLCITDCNAQMVEILQSTMERMIGFDMHGLRDRAIMPSLESALTGKDGYYEGWYHATTGPVEVWATFRTTPLHDNAGQIVGGVGIAEDLTARKQAEDARSASEARYRWLVETSPDIIYRFRLRPTPAFEYVNPAVTALTGYTPEEHCANPDLGRKLVHPEDQGLLETFFVSPETSPPLLTLRWVHKDGTILWTEQRLTLIRDEAGDVVALQGIARDVTERKQLEDTETFLAQTASMTATGEDFFNALARYLAESLQMDYICIDRLSGDCLIAQTVAIYFDGHFEDNVAYTLEDTPCGRVVGQTVCCFPQNVRGLFPKDAVLQEMVAESYVGVTLWDSRGQPIGLIAIIGRRPLRNPRLAENILRLVAVRAAGELERRQAEAVLHESQAKYHRLFEVMTSGFVLLEAVWDEKQTIVDFRYQEVNQATQTITGLSPAAMVGRTLWEVLGDKINLPTLELYKQVLTSGMSVKNEIFTPFLQKHIELHIFRFADNQIAVIYNDITERKQTEEALRTSEERWRLSIENMLEAYALHEALFDAAGRMVDYRFLEFNPAAQRITNITREDIIGKTTLELYPNVVERGLMDRYADVMATGAPAYIQDFYYAGDKLDKAFDISAFRIDAQHFVCVFSDVTERRQAEIALYQSEENLKEAQRIARLGRWELDLVHDHLHWSEGIYEIFELNRDAFAASYEAFLDAIHPDDRERVNRAYTESVANRQPYEIAHRLLLQDGRVKWVNEMGRTDYDAGGQPLRSVGVVQDITDRKQAEAEIQRLASFPQLNPEPVLEVNSEGHVTFYNAAAETIAAHINGGDLREFFPSDMPDLLALLAQQQSGQHYREVVMGEIAFGEYLYLTPEFQRIRIYAHNITERWQAETFLRMRLQLLEYATTHSLDELLQETLDRVEVLTYSPIGFYHFVEPDQQTLSLQAWSTRTMREFCKAEGKGLHYGIAQAGVWVDCVQQRRPVIHNDYATLPHRKGLPEGHVPVIRELVVPIIRGQQIVAILGIGNKPTDYTEKDIKIASYLADIAWEVIARKRTEEALRESEEKHRLLFETMAQGVVYHASDGAIISANPAAERILGLTFDQMQGRTSMDPRWHAIHEDGSDFPGETHPAMVALRTGQAVRDGVMGVFHPDREAYVWININATPQFRPSEPLPYRVYATFEDITERRQFETQLQAYAQQLEQIVAEKMTELDRERLKTIHSSRLASLGELATGIAHELRQPLTAMQFDADYLQLLAQQWEESPERAPVCPSTEVLEVGQSIGADIARCRRLIDHLRSFGRAPESQSIPLNLDQTITDSLLLTSERLRQHKIALEIHLDPDLPLILADTHKLEQVFLNLISNAEYALAEQESRIKNQESRIENQESRLSESSTEETSKIQNPFQKVLEIATGVEGRAVIATVRDNGCGIPANVLPRLFTPFFTTKPAGEGTGLGLSICADIVHEFGGEITVESGVDQGTTFTLSFPAMEHEGFGIGA